MLQLTPETRSALWLKLTAIVEDYLRSERGLTERSVEIYMPYVEAFLSSQAAANGRFRPRSLDAQAVRDHLLARTRGRSTAYAKLVATSLCAGSAEI